MECEVCREAIRELNTRRYDVNCSNHVVCEKCACLPGLCPICSQRPKEKPAPDLPPPSERLPYINISPNVANRDEAERRLLPVRTKDRRVRSTGLNPDTHDHFRPVGSSPEVYGLKRVSDSQPAVNDENERQSPSTADIIIMSMRRKSPKTELLKEPEPVREETLWTVMTTATPATKIVLPETPMAEKPPVKQELVEMSCPNHPEKPVEFCCTLHRVLLCAGCAWQHIAHKSQVYTYQTKDVKSDIALFDRLISQLESECQALKISLAAVSSGQVDATRSFDGLESSAVFLNRHFHHSNLKDSKFPSRQVADTPINSVIAVSGWEVSQVFQLGPFNQLVLLFRASRDGFSSEAFHSRCDHQGPTLVLVSAKQSKFGGFTSASWRSHSDLHSLFVKGSRGDFLFTLSPIRKVHCRNERTAIACNKHYGPVFGHKDLFISSNCNLDSKSHVAAGVSYGTPYMPEVQYLNNLGNFHVIDYEVFAAKRDFSHDNS